VLKTQKNAPSTHPSVSSSTRCTQVPLSTQGAVQSGEVRYDQVNVKCNQVTRMQLGDLVNNWAIQVKFRYDQVNPGTGQGDHQIGDGQADDVDVGRRAQTSTAPDGHHHEAVTKQRKCHHQRRQADLSSCLHRRHCLAGVRWVGHRAQVPLAVPRSHRSV